MSAVFGEAENGRRATIVAGDYVGTAGIRQRDGGREVAYFGKAPTSYPFSLTIDGAAAIASRKLDQRVAGFTVLWVPDQA